MDEPSSSWVGNAVPVPVAVTTTASAGRVFRLDCCELGSIAVAHCGNLPNRLAVSRIRTAGKKIRGAHSMPCGSGPQRPELQNWAARSLPRKVDMSPTSAETAMPCRASPMHLFAASKQLGPASKTPRPASLQHGAATKQVFPARAQLRAGSMTLFSPSMQLRPATMQV